MKHTENRSHNGQPALKVENLSAGYANARNALQNVTFSVEVGERAGILGPNGAGKSTLFKAIAGLLPHDSGCISMHGEDCRTSHTMIGYVPQQEAIDWDFPATVDDVVMMGRIGRIGWLRWPRRHDWDVVHDSLTRVNMQDFNKRQIGQLSGGQRRRVFIARALAQETDVLLLDEPFSGVDASAQSEILDVLDALRDGGVTVILATHDLSLAHRFDKLLLLNGQLIAYGTPEEVFTPETLGKVYHGRIGIVDSDGQRVMIMDEHGCPEEKGE